MLQIIKKKELWENGKRHHGKRHQEAYAKRAFSAKFQKALKNNSWTAKAE